MNCFLYFHLQQTAYLAHIKGEYTEESRIQNEMSKHVEKCATCHGFESLEEKLFGQKVVVNDHQD